MTAAWPGTVNQYMRRNNYSEAPEANKASFQPEVGPPIERRRSSISTVLIVGEGRGTRTEWDNLVTFYRTTLLDGALPFTRTNPDTGGTITCVFTEPPKLISVGARYRHYSLSFRQIG